MDAEKITPASEIMHNANIGWWKADIQDADYIYYGPIANLLGWKKAVVSVLKISTSAY